MTNATRKEMTRTSRSAAMSTRRTSVRYSSNTVGLRRQGRDTSIASHQPAQPRFHLEEDPLMVPVLPRVRAAALPARLPRRRIAPKGLHGFSQGLGILRRDDEPRAPLANDSRHLAPRAHRRNHRAPGGEQ